VPKIKTVSFSYERKFNLGDYNSASVGCTIWADVDIDAGESPEAAIAECAAVAKAAVREQSAPLFAKQSARVKEIFAGLPVELQAEAIKHSGANGAAKES